MVTSSFESSVTLCSFSRQVWIRLSLPGEIYIEVVHLHNLLVSHGLSAKTHLYDWWMRWKRIVVASGVDEQRMVTGSRVAGRLGRHVAECSGFIALLMAYALQRQPQASIVVAVIACVLSLVPICLAAIPDNSAISVLIPGFDVTLTLHPNGLVTGFADILALHIEFLRVRWNHCINNANHGHAVDPILGSLSEPHLRNLLVFTARTLTEIRSRHPAWNSLNCVCAALVTIMSTLLRNRLRAACAQFVQASAASATAGTLNDMPRIIRLLGSRRARNIDGNVAWSFLKRADETKMPIQDVILLSSNQPGLALTKRTGWTWMAFRTKLILERSSNVFRHTCQLSLAVDPSTHSGKECLVGVAYSSLLNVAVIPAIKHIPRGKQPIPHLLPLEPDIVEASCVFIKMHQVCV